MRFALMAVALSGCLAPVQFDVLARRAAVNELEAGQFALGRRVYVTGVVADITTLDTERVRYSTTERTQQLTSFTRRRTIEQQPVVVRESLPYATLTVADGATVYCFMSMMTAVQLAKGARVSLSGAFDKFVREPSGQTSTRLFDCRPPD